MKTNMMGSLEIFDTDKNKWIDVYSIYKKNNGFIGLFGKGLRKIDRISEELHIINFNNFKKGKIKNYIDLCYNPHIHKNLFIPIDENYCLINDEEKTIYDVKKENMFRIGFVNDNISLLITCNNNLLKNHVKEKHEDIIKVLSSYKMLLYILKQNNNIDKFSYFLIEICQNNITKKVQNYLFKEDNEKFYLYFSFYLFQINYVDVDLLKRLNSIYDIDTSFQIKFITE